MAEVYAGCGIPAEPAPVLCEHCHGDGCEDCAGAGIRPDELHEADVTPGPDDEAVAS